MPTLGDAALAPGWYPSGDGTSSGYKAAPDSKPNSKHSPARARGGPAGMACFWLVFADNLQGSISSLLIPVGLAEVFSRSRGFLILSTDGLVPHGLLLCLSLAGPSVTETTSKRARRLPGTGCICSERVLHRHVENSVVSS